MSSKPADGYSLQRRMIAVTTATLCGIALTAGVLTFAVSAVLIVRTYRQLSPQPPKTA